MPPSIEVQRHQEIRNQRGWAKWTAMHYLYNSFIYPLLPISNNLCYKYPPHFPSVIYIYICIYIYMHFFLVTGTRVDTENGWESVTQGGIGSWSLGGSSNNGSKGTHPITRLSQKKKNKKKKRIVSPALVSVTVWRCFIWRLSCSWVERSNVCETRKQFFFCCFAKFLKQINYLNKTVCGRGCQTNNVKNKATHTHTHTHIRGLSGNEVAIWYSQKKKKNDNQK